MKRVLFLAIILAGFVQVHAQSAKGRINRDSINNTYKKEFLINPFSFIISGFELGYGRMVKENRLLKFYAGYYYSERAGLYNNGDNTSSGSGTRFEYSNMETVRLETQWLFLRPSKDESRFFAGGYMVFKNSKVDVEGFSSASSVVAGSRYTARASSLCLGILLGMRAYTFDNVFIDLYFGGGPTIPLGKNNDAEAHVPVIIPHKRSIVPRAGLSFGLAF